MVLQNRDGARACMPADEGHPDPSPVVWFSLVVMGMLPNPLALFFFSPDPQRMNVVSPSNGWFWLLLTMFIVVVLHDSLPPCCEGSAG